MCICVYKETNLIVSLCVCVCVYLSASRPLSVLVCARMCEDCVGARTRVCRITRASGVLSHSVPGDIRKVQSYSSNKVTL